MYQTSLSFSSTAERDALHAIDATPARWRGGADSSPLDGARAAAPSPRNDFVKNYRVHPTHWLISTQVLMVSFYNAHLNFYPNYIQMVLR